MPRRGEHVTAKERTFVDAFTKTRDATLAATKAGYAQPHSAGSKLMQRPVIVEMTRLEAERWLREEAGSIGLRVLGEIAQDRSMPAPARNTAAKALVDYSGIAVNPASGKSLSEMTGEELQQQLALAEARKVALEHAAAERARPVVEGEVVEVSSGGLFD